MWYAAGNTTSYAMAARKGLGVLGFSVGELSELAPVLEVDGRIIGTGAIGPVTSKLQATYADLTTASGTTLPF
jgi:branched-subunit amino acid aminotransferase/4-amino-4-deoxychorismate lyase